MPCSVGGRPPRKSHETRPGQCQISARARQDKDKVARRRRTPVPSMPDNSWLVVRNRSVRRTQTERDLQTAHRKHRQQGKIVPAKRRNHKPLISGMRPISSRTEGGKKSALALDAGGGCLGKMDGQTSLDRFHDHQNLEVSAGQDWARLSELDCREH